MGCIRTIAARPTQRQRWSFTPPYWTPCMLRAWTFLFAFPDSSRPPRPTLAGLKLKRSSAAGATFHGGAEGGNAASSCAKVMNIHAPAVCAVHLAHEALRLQRVRPAEMELDIRKCSQRNLQLALSQVEAACGQQLDAFVRCVASTNSNSSFACSVSRESLAVSASVCPHSGPASRSCRVVHVSCTAHRVSCAGLRCSCARRTYADVYRFAVKSAGPRQLPHCLRQNRGGLRDRRSATPWHNKQGRWLVRAHKRFDI